MALLTETELRLRLKGEDLDRLGQYRVGSGTIVTPSARAFLSEHKIALLVGDPPEQAAAVKAGGESRTSPGEAAAGDNGNLPAFTPPARYKSLAGGFFEEKPEHMTALRGTVLVNKDHPLIRFRGRVDSLMAKLLTARFALAGLGLAGAAAELDEIRGFAGEILRCEVLGEPLKDPVLLGMGGDEIRARSHTPKKFYGLGHFAAGPEHGEAVALLNALRCEAREVELCACDAFKTPEGPPARADLVEALNRLSSLFYVMMFRVLDGAYGK